MNSSLRNGMSHSMAGKLGYEKSKAKIEKMQFDRIDAYKKHPHLCKCCSAPIPYEKRHNKFCSSSCSASYNNPRKKRKGKILLCKQCGKEFFSNRSAVFCSLRCSSEYFSNKAFEELLSTIQKTGEFPKGSGKTNNMEANRPQVKRYLERMHGHRCSICGNTEWMGKPIPLVVDHIDGNPSNCKVENFRLVCGNCDMQLDTYAGRNKGHGRTWRKTILC